MQINLLIKGGRIIDPRNGIDSTGDILILDGKISRVSNTGIKDIPANTELFKADGFIVCPGFIDLHCHLREPGYEDKETIATGSMAAAAGGFTTICCMPNTSPPLDNAALIKFIKDKAAAEAAVRVLPIGCITRGRAGKELTEMNELAEAGAIGFSDDGDPVSSARIMFLALQYSKYSGLPVINHCEDKEIAGNGVINEGWVSSRLGLRGIPAAAEEIMIARDIYLANLTGARLHIAHVSTKGSVKLIRQAKADGIKVTAEVTPNHLLLTEERVMAPPSQNGQELAYDTSAKVNPPLRTESDIEALIEGLKDGTIDAIATDHAPHTKVDKMCEFGTAAFGISSFETAFAGLLSLVHRNLLDYKTLISAMTAGPADIINSPAGISGGLSEGKPADIAVFNPSLTWTVDSNSFISMGKNTPYNEMEMKGKVLITVAGGKPAFRDKSIK